MNRLSAHLYINNRIRLGHFYLVFPFFLKKSFFFIKKKGGVHRGLSAVAPPSGDVEQSFTSPSRKKALGQMC